MPYSTITVLLTPAEMTALNNHFVGIAAILRPHLVNLTPKERKAIQSVKNMRLEFTTKAFEHAPAHPELIPGFLDLAVAGPNFKTFNELRPFMGQLIPLSEAVHDTYLVLGAQSYQFAREFYYNVKRAMERNVPGTTAIYNDLKKLFEGQGNSEHEAPPQSAPPVEQ